MAYSVMSPSFSPIFHLPDKDVYMCRSVMNIRKINIAYIPVIGAKANGESFFILPLKDSGEPFRFHLTGNKPVGAGPGEFPKTGVIAPLPGNPGVLRYEG